MTKAASNPQAAFDFIAWQAGMAGQKATWVDREFFLEKEEIIHSPYDIRPRRIRMNMQKNGFSSVPLCLDMHSGA